MFDVEIARKRTGTFHEIAYDIITKNRPIMEVSKDEKE